MAFLPVIVVCSQLVCANYSTDIVMTREECEASIKAETPNVLRVMGQHMESPYVNAKRCEWTSKVPLRYRVINAWPKSENVIDKGFDWKAAAITIINAIAKEE